MAGNLTDTISLERGSTLFNRRVLAMGEVTGEACDVETLRDRLKFNLIFRSNSEELFQRHNVSKLIGEYLDDLEVSNDNIESLIDNLPQLHTKLDFEARLTTLRRLTNQLSSCRLGIDGMSGINWQDDKLYYLTPCEDGSLIVTSADMKGHVYDAPIMYHDADDEIVAWRTEDCILDYLNRLFGPTIAIRPTISRDTRRPTKLEFHGELESIPGSLAWLEPEVVVIENDYLYLDDLDQLLRLIAADENDDDPDDRFSFDELIEELEVDEEEGDDEEEDDDDDDDTLSIFEEIDDDEEDVADEDEDEESDFTLDRFLEQDRLIEYPYVGFDAYLKFLELAAIDHRVTEIAVCLYRIGDNPILFYVLREAVRRGKKVFVNLEPAANGEEIINQFWIDEMRAAGINVIDHGDGLHKVHAKLTAITMVDGRMIVQIGTGNYHWKTTTQYNDLSLITANPETCSAVERMFRWLRFEIDGPGETGDQNRDIIMTDDQGELRLIELIREQGLRRNAGFIAIKANAFDGDTMIAKELELASMRGCRVDMIIRGSCTWVPRLLNDKVRIRSVVGEQLEHARVYQFGEGEAAELYLGSLDPIDRKLHLRTEVMVRVIDRDAREELKRYLDEYLEGRVGNVWQMIADGKRVEYQLRTVN